MSSLTSTARLRSDVTEVDKDLKEVETTVNNSLRSMVSTMRQTVQMGIFLAQVSGQAIDQVLALQVQVGLLSIELALAAQALQAGATFGLSAALQAGFQLAAIISMLILIGKIKQKREAAARQQTQTVSELRMVLFR